MYDATVKIFKIKSGNDFNVHYKNINEG